MTIAELNALDHAAFVRAIGGVFEDSPWVAERAWHARPFHSLDDLHRAMTDEVERATAAEQLTLLRAHPDLGGRARMSAASTEEQAGAGLDSLTPDEFEIFHELNRAYHARFGFPFLFAVKGCTKHDILAALSARMESSADEELRQALREVYRIAWFRLENILP